MASVCNDSALIHLNKLGYILFAHEKLAFCVRDILWRARFSNTAIRKKVRA